MYPTLSLMFEGGTKGTDIYYRMVPNCEYL